MRSLAAMSVSLIGVPGAPRAVAAVAQGAVVPDGHLAGGKNAQAAAGAPAAEVPVLGQNVRGEAAVGALADAVQHAEADLLGPRLGEAAQPQAGVDHEPLAG